MSPRIPVQGKQRVTPATVPLWAFPWVLGQGRGMKGATLQGTHVTARQLGDGLRRFLGTADQAAASSNIQVRHHGSALAEVSLLLQRLKEQLLYENRSLPPPPRSLPCS